MIVAASTLIVVLASVFAFLVIILILVATLVFARAKLSAVGEVVVTINDKKELKVSQGGTLLSTLAEQGIFLPSACGGGGTCGQCRCRVVEGGGSILVTEADHFTRKEQHSHWRLGCQVKIRENLKIEVPEEVLGIRKWTCEVVSNNNVATFIKEFVVKLPEGEILNFKSGGYVQIDVPKYEISFKDFIIEDKFRVDWDKYKMWGLNIKSTEETFRAYSMANHPAEGNVIILNIRIATPPWDRAKNAFANVPPGICSSYLFSLKKGDKVTLSGPYGDFFIKDTDREMLYIGGGAGMAPLRSHLFHLFHTLKSNRKVTYWYGARSKREVFYEEHFRSIEREFPNFKFNIALSEPTVEDNWTGYVGFIHQVLLDNYLNSHEEPEEIEYYMCGPPMMNTAVEKMLYNLGVPDEMIDFDDFGE